MNPAREPASAVKVTVTVTVEMTEAQRDAYTEQYGVGFVAAEVRERLRPELAQALHGSAWLGWLADHATVTISKPQASEGKR